MSFSNLHLYNILLVTHPALSCVFEPHNAKLYEKSQFVTSPLGLRMLPHLESSGLDLDVVDDVSILDTAPCDCLCTNVRFNLTQLKNPEITNHITVLLGTYFRLPFISK